MACSLCIHHTTSLWVPSFRPYPTKEENRPLIINNRSKRSTTFQALSSAQESPPHAHLFLDDGRDIEDFPSNYLIQNCIKQGKVDEAFILCKKMQVDAQEITSIAFVSLIKAYTEVGDVQKCHTLYAYMCETGLMERDNVFGNTFVSMYAKFGMLGKAKEVFDKLQVRTVVSWNALISGYAKNSQEDRKSVV